VPDSDHEIEPNTSWTLVRHFIREMSWPMLIAIGLISFLFFFGMINALIKFAGYEVASLEFPIGPIFGFTSALTLVVAGAIIKLQRSD